MKKLFFAIALLLSVSFSAQISFNTGSVTMDTDLNSINVSANVNIGVFEADLATKYNVSDKKIEALRVSVKLQPAEIFLSLELARITNRSIDDVVTVYKANKSEGWGVVAKKLGIKPGSSEFHALKAATKSKKDKGNQGKGNSNGKSGNHGKGNSGKGKK